MVMSVNDDKMQEIDALSPLDYDQMKALGLKCIQELSHQKWTDFNIHDPGVTIWEALCFSLADLAYRTNFEIKDLLTEGGNTHPTLDGTMFLPNSIFSFNPLTKDDYRKFVLENVKEVQNVRLDKVDKKVSVKDTVLKGMGISHLDVKGFYQVTIQCVEAVKTEKERKEVEGKVLDLLNSHRNLCERFLPVKALKPVDVGICLEIETKKYSDMSAIVRDIYNRVKEYVYPSIRHYTASEMMEKGKSYEEIFQGYVPDDVEMKDFLGFIDRDELKDFKKRDRLYLSDVLNLIMRVDGVSAVTHFHFVLSDDSKNICDVNDYYLEFKKIYRDDYYFRFSPLVLQDGEVSLNQIFINKGGYSVRFELPSAGSTKENSTVNSVVESPNYLDIPRIESRCRNIDRYYSFQNILPQCYKVGKKCLSKYDTPTEIVRAKQLKGYLSFFDQFLSDYLVQLDSLGKFFSVEANGDDPSPLWFHGYLSDDEVEKISEIIKFKDHGHALNYEHTEFSDFLKYDRIIVREKILDHLLARFNEVFPDFDDFSTESDISAMSQEDFRAFLSSSMTKDDGDGVDRELLEDKKALLKHYPEISQNRSRSTTLRCVKDRNESAYVRQLELSGVEKRILSKLGINNYCARITSSSGSADASDSTLSPFTIHILEHILFFCESKVDSCSFLQMTKDAYSGELVNDPYSFHVTVVLPGWLPSTLDLKYREFVENVIREELPAHVISKICWVSSAVMRDVENMLESLYLGSNTFESMVEAQIASIKSIFSEFKNVYPSVELLNTKEQRIGFFCLPDEDSFVDQGGVVDRSALSQLVSVVKGLDQVPSLLKGLSRSSRNNSGNDEKSDSFTDTTVQSEDGHSTESPVSSVNRLATPASSSGKKSVKDSSVKEKNSTSKNMKKTSTKKTSEKKKK